MQDLISRQAAIDALDTGLWGVEWDKALATAMLKDLPPSNAVEVVRCKDCTYADMGECTHKFGLIVANDENYCSYGERKEQ